MKVRASDRVLPALYRREMKGNVYSWLGVIWLVAAAGIFSVVAYLLLTDKELSLLAQGEMLYTLSQVIVSIGLVMSVASASSTISGEVESGTFESLLLTPVRHLRIAAEKLGSVLTMWLIIYAVSIPYLLAVASGTNLGGAAVLHVGIYGTTLVAGLSAISIAVSVALKSSKNSIMLSLMIVLVLLAPSVFFAASLKKTGFGVAIEDINPVSHAINSLDSVLVDNE